MTTFTTILTLLTAALGLCALWLALGMPAAPQDRHPRHRRRAPH